jgi:hypothetical protein
MNRPLRPLAALATVALIAAGCSSGSAESASTAPVPPASNRPGGMTILNAAMRGCGNLLKEAAEGQR